MKYTSHKLGEILINAGLLTADKVEAVLKEQKGSGKRLGELLIEKKIISQSQLMHALVTQLGIAYRDVSLLDIDPIVLNIIPETMSRKHVALPIGLKNNVLTVAMADPLDYTALHDIGAYTGLNLDVVISEKEKIIDKINARFHSDKTREMVADLKSGEELLKDFQDTTDTIDDTADSNHPVVRFINGMFDQAISLGASDIHVEPLSKEMRIRMRVDGHMVEHMRAKNDILLPIISRIKFISGMNIAERRLPQDGRITLRTNNQEVDMRVSVLPTVHGEKAVIRLISTLGAQVARKDLGLSEYDMECVDRLLSLKNGIILVTGPTGSGKTTTLYTMLRELNQNQVNVVTVEDPAECMIEGVTQVQVNTAANLSFASVLRAILRQDPDVVMVGEIRDQETAEIAVRVSITGHLVLSTLHTNDAPSSVIRLVDMGIPPFLVTASVAGVIAQRLVRRICPMCKISYKADPADLDLLNMPVNADVTLHRGTGCPHCQGTGYKGRVAIFEIMIMNPELREAIHSGAPQDKLRQMAVASGMVSLRDSCKALALRGVTTVNEMLDVVYTD